MADNMLEQIIDASAGTGVSPSECPEIVSAYVLEQAALGRQITSEVAKGEIRAAEILAFGLFGGQDLRPKTMIARLAGRVGGGLV